MISFKNTFILSFFCFHAVFALRTESSLVYHKKGGGEISNYAHRVNKIKSQIRSLKPNIQNILHLSREKWIQFGNMLGISNMDKDWKAQKVIEHDVYMYRKCSQLHKRSQDNHELTFQTVFDDTCESTPYLGQMIGVLQLILGDDHGWDTLRSSSRATIIDSLAEEDLAAGLGGGLLFDGAMALINFDNHDQFSAYGIIIKVLENSLKDQVDLTDLRRISAQIFQDIMPACVHRLHGHGHAHHHNDKDHFRADALDKNPLIQTVSLTGKYALKQTVHTAIHYVSHLIAGHVAHATTGQVIGSTATVGASTIFSPIATFFLLPLVFIGFCDINERERAAEFNRPIPSFTCSDAAVPLLEQFDEQAEFNTIWGFEKEMIQRYEEYRATSDEKWKNMIDEHYEKFLKIRVYKDCKGHANCQYPFELYKKRILIEGGNQRKQTKQLLAGQFSSDLMNHLIKEVEVKKKLKKSADRAIVHLLSKEQKKMADRLHKSLKDSLNKTESLLNDEKTIKGLYNQYLSVLDGIDRVMEDAAYAKLVQKRPKKTLPRLIQKLEDDLSSFDSFKEEMKTEYMLSLQNQRASQESEKHVCLSDAEAEVQWVEHFNDSRSNIVESYLMKTVKVNLEKGMDNFGICRTCHDLMGLNITTKLEKRTKLALECYFLEKYFRSRMG
jgi:hypothetical protein